MQSNINHTNEDKIVNQVRITHDYGKFKIISLNRDELPRHINSLMASMMNRYLGYAAPIIVDQYFNILDGQHRFFSAKTLNFPVYYLIVDLSVGRDESESSEHSLLNDIKILNTNTKTWGDKTILAHYNKMYEHRVGGPKPYQDNLDFYKPYIDMKRFMKEYDLKSYGIVVSLLTDRKDSEYQMMQFRNGFLKINDLERSRKLIQFAKECYAIVNDASKPFLYALWTIFRANELYPDQVDLNKFKERLKKNQVEFVSRKNTEDYIYMFETVILNKGFGKISDEDQWLQKIHKDESKEDQKRKQAESRTDKDDYLEDLPVKYTSVEQLKKLYKQGRD